jgi:hypothetical protein
VDNGAKAEKTFEDFLKHPVQAALEICGAVRPTVDISPLA